MDKSRFEHLVEKRMNKDKEGEKFDLNMIVEMMEQLGGLSPLDEAVEGGEYARIPARATRRRQAYKGLPSMDISMFAWAEPVDSTSPEAVQRFKKERGKLDRIMKGIRSGSRNLETTLGKLQTLLTGQRVSRARSKPKEVQQAIDSLFAIKMITEIVANFNVSAAGYIFEPFMAALIGPSGRQVPTSERILPDIQAGRNKYFGLKLIGKGKEVGGSARDLINFYVSKGENRKIDYIVAWKSSDKVEFYIVPLDIKKAVEIFLSSPLVPKAINKMRTDPQMKTAVDAFDELKNNPNAKPAEIKARLETIINDSNGKLGQFRITPTDVKNYGPIATIPLGANEVGKKVQQILGQIAQDLGEIQIAVEATQEAVFNYAESGLKEKEQVKAERAAENLEDKVEGAATL